MKGNRMVDENYTTRNPPLSGSVKWWHFLFSLFCVLALAYIWTSIRDNEYEKQIESVKKSLDGSIGASNASIKVDLVGYVDKKYSENVEILAEIKDAQVKLQNELDKKVNKSELERVSVRVRRLELSEKKRSSLELQLEELQKSHVDSQQPISLLEQQKKDSDQITIRRIVVR